MTAGSQAPIAPDIVTSLAGVVGSDQVLTAPADLQLYSRDIFFWDDAPWVAVVVRPGTPVEIAGVLAIARAAGLAVAPRGGGVSYTKGYVPERAGTILIDLCRFNQVIEINAEDLYATVGAACTWQSLADALKPHNLRSVVKGPISGSVATIGGAVAQHKSGSMAGVLGIEVVLADGRIIHTGSGARGSASSPFYRLYGPDLTGLFSGDTGAYGIKSKVTLALEPIPAGAAFASVAFENLSDLAAVMTGISRSGIPANMIGMDPLKNKTATKVDLKEGLATLGKVVSDAGSLFKGLKQAVGIAAAGRSSLDDVPWSLHVTVEGHDQTAADRALDVLRPLWRERGRDLQPSVPIALRAKPYSIRGIVGINGERWVPVHGVFPLSGAQTAVREAEAYFAVNAARMTAHGITHSFLTVAAGPYWLLEPMFYWFDELSPLHAKVLGAKFAKFAHIPANPKARAVVTEMRGEVAALFEKLGATHSQIGKFYDFEHAIEPETYGLLTDLKHMLDPKGMLNPGNLGWR